MPDPLSEPPDQEVLATGIEDPAAQRLIGEGYRGHVLGLIYRRITPEHITQINAEEARENERAHQRYFANGRWLLSVLVVAVLFVVYLIERLGTQNPQLLQEILKGAGLFIGGAISGFGASTAWWKRGGK